MLQTIYLLPGLGLLEVVSLSAPECRENYEEMITEQKRVYSQCWETILEEHFHLVSIKFFFLLGLILHMKIKTVSTIFLNTVAACEAGNIYNFLGKMQGGPNFERSHLLLFSFLKWCVKNN